MSSEKKRVVIVGAGFGGIAAAKILCRAKYIDLIIIDRQNHHLFQPLLYQVATAGLSPADIAAPVRSIFRDYKNTFVVMDEVVDIDRSARRVIARNSTYTFDYLIVATGSTHSYFGHDDWAKYASGLKTLADATEIRAKVLLAYELAEKEHDIEKQRELLTFVVVGGGPTGVEMAGAIAEIARYTLESDFRKIDPESARIILIEAGPRLLAGFHPKLSTQAQRELEALGVQVWVNSRVTEVGDGYVALNQERIRAKTVIWAAGVRPSSLGSKISKNLDKLGRVIVNEDLSTQEDPNIFIIGDLAHFKDLNGQPLPGLAPVAMQQGRTVALNIIRELRGQARRSFQYRDKGIMAAIGRRKAVAQFGASRVSGFVAWILWLFVHIYYLIGFRNKLFVLMQWFWSYINFKKGARLIVEYTHNERSLHP